LLIPTGNQATVAQAATRWVLVYVATARSQRNVTIAARRVEAYLVPQLGSLPLRDLGGDHVREYRLWLQSKGLAVRTVRHVLADLRCMLNWAVEAELIPRSPFPRRVMPRIQETPPDRLEDAEVARLLAIREPQSFVVRLGLATGMRWSEMCRATPGDLAGRYLVVSQTKSGRLRRVPVPLLLADEIRNRSGRLCPYGVGSAGSFGELAGRLSGVERFHVHQLRHTFACRWIERGGSLASLQQILGHASVVTTQIYARLSDEHVFREAERIAGNAAVD
jgi:integrase